MGSHFLRDEPELPFSQMRWPKRGQADRKGREGRGVLFFEGGNSKRAIQHPLNSDICSDGNEGGHKMGGGM